MEISKIVELLGCKIVCGHDLIDQVEVTSACSSDLMSDVLTLEHPHTILLITGLCNLQALRTAEMADIKCILFVRDKHLNLDMIKLGQENEMILMEYSGSMFKTAGLLYEAGIKYVY
jgi:hypothetical protein